MQGYRMHLRQVPHGQRAVVASGEQERHLALRGRTAVARVRLAFRACGPAAQHQLHVAHPAAVQLRAEERLYSWFAVAVQRQLRCKDKPVTSRPHQRCQ